MINNLNGEPLTKQFSHSLITPSSLSTYQHFFRQNSTNENGFVEVSDNNSGQWTKKWMSYDESVLYFYKDPLTKDQDSFRIPMDKVISFRADNVNGEHPLISIVTTDKKFKLRLSNIDEMRKWLFCFQKSVALVISHIVEGRKKEEYNEDEKVWLKDLGNGHGHRDRGHRKNMVNLRAYTMEDVNERSFHMPRDSGFGRNPSRIGLNDEGSGSPAPKLLAVSPAIPIIVPTSFKGKEEGSFVRDRVASSYRTEEFSPLTEVMRQQPSLRNPNDDDDDDNSSPRNSFDEDEDGMMFDMDEHIEEKNSKRTNDRSKGTPQANNNSSTGVAELLRQSRSHTPQSASTTPRQMTPRSSFSAGTPNVSLLQSRSSLKWDSGYCTKVGAREKNEDRFISLPHLSHFNQSPSSFFDGNPPPNRFNVGSYTSGITKSLLSTSIEAAAQKGSYLPGGGSECSCAYFAVYDGHAGDLAATYLQENLHDRICRHNLFPSEVELAIYETFIEIDREFLDICQRRKMYAGTTALGAFIIGSQLTVYNVGDSMAVLCTNGEAVEMSDSHKPNRKDESDRILRANGWITEEKELYMGRLHRIDYDDPMAVNKAKNINWVTIYRVCGELALTRSIGDPDYKGFTPGERTDAFFLWPDGHNQIFHADLIIPDPEFKSKTLTEEDEFLILASDGLWDVVSPAEAVKHVQEAFRMDKTPIKFLKNYVIYLFD
eukprot:CAMPEP_0173144310 /NCGR_PEP_ID=MMETSP1105-20130129/7153_1 /TAXON_ID=2985 /ORGANISM="Ochromonas sp., Strain BG-1" /LENGTH=712 /DNA_ID=CAMNT_0014057959 /DNA_START=152 /DNA_END=2291 /DNA_ORIENTATION=+